jgi:hypothetical protein
MGYCLARPELRWVGLAKSPLDGNVHVDSAFDFHWPRQGLIAFAFREIGIDSKR